MVDVCKILKESKNIVVLGISSNPNKISRTIADFLVNKGYKVAGVNPAISSAGDILVYPTLKEVPFQIDIVNVFRRPETLHEIVDDVIAVEPKSVWLQLGIVNDAVLSVFEDNDIIGVQDKCIMVEHRKCL